MGDSEKTLLFTRQAIQEPKSQQCLMCQHWANNHVQLPLINCALRFGPQTTTSNRNLKLCNHLCYLEFENLQYSFSILAKPQQLSFHHIPQYAHFFQGGATKNQHCLLIHFLICCLFKVLCHPPPCEIFVNTQIIRWGCDRFEGLHHLQIQL